MSAAGAREACTVLALGARGKHRNAGFTLAGRTCVQSAGGGLWNEWTVAFDDGRQAFLAEALGAFTLLFARPMAPPFASLAMGQRLETGFKVVERGVAKRVARWGDVPEAPRSYRYADLSSASGECATLDYGSTERGKTDVFIGRKVRLAKLGLQPRPERPRFLAAPGGPPPKGLALWLSVGDEGKLGTGRTRAAPFRVIGITQRSIRIEGERTTWEEYVLHAPAEGLRWLVVSDGHWNLVEPVEAGLVAESDRGATYLDDAYTPWSSGKARLEWATGELPWAAAVGDVVMARDYVRASYMLSCESTEDEVSWSRGAYLSPAAVARAFGTRPLPKPTGRAPNLPKSPKRSP